MIMGALFILKQRNKTRMSLLFSMRRIGSFTYSRTRFLLLDEQRVPAYHRNHHYHYRHIEFEMFNYMPLDGNIIYQFDFVICLACIKCPIKRDRGRPRYVARVHCFAYHVKEIVQHPCQIIVSIYVSVSLFPSLNLEVFFRFLVGIAYSLFSSFITINMKIV